MTIIRKAISLAAVLLSCSIFTLRAYGEHETPAAQEKPLAFHEVNEQQREYYARAKEEIRKTLGPLIICTRDSLTLVKGTHRSTVYFLSLRYTGLKEVAHITLGTFLLLTNHTDEKLDADKIAQLQQYKSGIEKAAAGLKTNQGLQSDDNLARQHELIDTTLAFLGKVIVDRKVSHEQLRRYARSCAVDDLENSYEAVGSQITKMDNAISEWHKNMTPDEWRDLHVVIITAHMPREGLVSYQYFEKLLNVKQEGEQIVVAEGPMDEEQAVDLLLIHILDKKIAVDFFDDPSRMHRDILSDGAKRWLRTHKILGGLDPHKAVK